MFPPWSMQGAAMFIEPRQGTKRGDTKGDSSHQSSAVLASAVDRFVRASDRTVAAKEQESDARPFSLCLQAVPPIKISGPFCHPGASLPVSGPVPLTMRGMTSAGAGGTLPVSSLKREKYAGRPFTVGGSPMDQIAVTCICASKSYSSLKMTPHPVSHA